MLDDCERLLAEERTLQDEVEWKDSDIDRLRQELSPATPGDESRLTSVSPPLSSTVSVPS